MALVCTNPIMNEMPVNGSYPGIVCPAPIKPKPPRPAPPKPVPGGTKTRPVLETEDESVLTSPNTVPEGPPGPDNPIPDRPDAPVPQHPRPFDAGIMSIDDNGTYPGNLCPAPIKPKPPRPAPPKPVPGGTKQLDENGIYPGVVCPGPIRPKPPRPAPPKPVPGGTKRPREDSWDQTREMGAPKVLRAGRAVLLDTRWTQHSYVNAVAV